LWSTKRFARTGEWFLVVPGHELCIVDGETVARIEARRAGHSIMEKLAEAGELARALDPRG
jgi:hypothetical protein